MQLSSKKHVCTAASSALKDSTQAKHALHVYTFWIHIGQWARLTCRPFMTDEATNSGGAKAWLQTSRSAS